MHSIHRNFGLAALSVFIQVGCDAPGAADPGPITQRGDPGGTCGYRTQTQFDWGAPCADGDPDSAACLRDAHFDEPFHEGLIVGCGVLTANLVNSHAVELSLPASGKVRALHPSEAGAYDGQNDPPVGTAFFGHVVALALNLEYDKVAAYNPDHPGAPLGELVYTDPNSPCVGMTVQDVFYEASAALGGCPAVLTPTQLSSCVQQINAVFRHGIDPNGTPICDDRFAPGVPLE